MNDLSESERLIDELMRLVDDGTITEEERSLVTQTVRSMDPPLEVDANLVQELRAAVAREPLSGERQETDKTLVQSIVEKLQALRHSETVNEVASVGSSDQFDPHMPVQDLTGQSIGSYRVLQLIGRGGMGAVYEATDQLLHRHVALKVMLPSIAARSQNRSRFLREARAAASVEHDHICPIYQVGEDRGTAFIAMPLLVGETLESRLKNRRLTYLEVIEIMQQVAQGLSAAHQIGLIHRDIKPANVWIEKRRDGQERVRLLDFGLAQMETEEPALTQSGSIMGTPSYMAPEQARGAAVDARTDLFSVGAMLYELLTGGKAFQGKSPTAVLSAILTDTPVAPAIMDGSCPKCLSDLTVRLLEKEPAKRIPSAMELNAELARCRSEMERSASASAAPRVKASTAETIADSMPTLPAGLMTSSSSARGSTNWHWPLIVAAGFGGLALAGLLFFRTSTGTLVVEANDEAQLLFEKGELQVLDESGNVAYRLTANAPAENISAGKYQVRVAGADGLAIDTEEFVIHRKEKVVVRISAKANPAEKPPVEPPARPTSWVDTFKGKPVFATDFKDPREWPIPLVDNTLTLSQIKNEQLIYQQRSHDPNAPFLTITLAGRLNRGAFLVRCKTEHGALFFNFCSRHNGVKSRTLSLGITDGTWSLFVQRQDLEDKVWKRGQNTPLVSSPAKRPGLAKDDWLEVAYRWSEKDYDVWLDGEHVAGGTLPSEELKIGQPQPTQIGLRTEPNLLPIIEIDRIAVWDQTDVSLEDSKVFMRKP